MDQNEIDISPLVGLINRGIYKISSSLQLLWQKKWRLLIAFVIGLSVFFFRHQQKTEIYRSTLMVSSPGISNADAAQLIFEIRDYIFDGNYAALAKEMGCSEALSSQIRSISYTGRFGEKFNSRKLPKRAEIFTINIKYPEGTELNKIQEAFQYYFNHRSYALEKQFDAEQNLKFKIALNENQLRSINNLIANIPEKETYRSLVPQEQLAISNLMNEATALQVELSELNKELEILQKGILQIVTPFDEQIHCENAIDYLEMMLIALCFPLVLSVLLIAFKKKI